MNLADIVKSMIAVGCLVTHPNHYPVTSSVNLGVSPAPADALRADANNEMAKAKTMETCEDLGTKLEAALLTAKCN